MAARPTIAIVGPGRLGNALAIELKRAGYKITEIVSRDNPQSRRKARVLAGKVGASPFTLKNADLSADLIWFCVPDREISPAAGSLSASARWKGKIAVHSSGALTSDELNVLRQHGAAVASVHPFMTFVTKSIPSLKRVPFAVEGDAAAVRIARRIVRDLGGESFILRKQDKVAYHAWGAFASPLLVSLLANGEQVAGIAGIPPGNARKKMLPILRQTLVNYAEFGPAGAFSGPLIRGDAEIVRKHLQVLKKNSEARAAYVALTRSALRHLPARNRERLVKVLRG